MKEEKMAQWMLFFWKKPEHIRSLLEKWSFVKNLLPLLFRSFGLSLISQIIAVCMFYFGFKALSPSSTLLFSVFFLIVPLGLFAMTVPISPGGLGVGETAFLVLLQWIDPSSSTSGAEWCFLVRSIMLGVNFLVGGLIYVRFKKSVLNVEADPVS
jgi:uncharacterized membrane protein YbhN (UPF0104 family)